jgi:hypothetical protein
MAKSKKTRTKRTAKGKSAAKKAKYACYHCGTQVVMDNCGVGFRHLVCCGKVMKKKRK